MALAQPKLSDVARLIQTGQDNWEERWKELREDFDKKHQENRERRHTQQNQITNLEGRAALHEGRTAVLETKVVSIVGDNTGGSGLLHEIDRKQDALQSEVGGIKQDISAIKQTVQDTPSINKWVYGAIAVLAFLVVIMPIAVMIILAIIYKH